MATTGSGCGAAAAGGIRPAGAHTHSFTTNSTGAHTHALTIDNAGAHTHSLTINATGAVETRPKNVALLYCRKD